MLWLIEIQGAEYGILNGFDRYCNEQLDIAKVVDYCNFTEQWRQVKEFGLRHTCSPFSGVEVNGELVIENYQLEYLTETIRVYIDNPENPEHQHQQENITKESMALANPGHHAG